MSYRVLLFDLFGTVVLFRPEVPVVHVGPATWRSTSEYLRDDVRRIVPEVSFEAFQDAMREVTREIVATRVPEHREVLSKERFLRVLARLGVDQVEADAKAETLCLAHMGYLASRVEMPAEHGALIGRLARTHTIGLVSNFDHGPTAHGILARNGVDSLFRTIVISADHGRRKPHASIFLDALDALGAGPADALYIGDSPYDDVVGAHAAGMHVAWINAGGEEFPAGLPAPHHVVRSLPEIEGIVRR